MNLRIEEIRYENIRDIGSLHLEFTKPGTSEPRHISLVQMPNGTGKTTTMGLIRHLILGSELDDETVMGYEPETGASEGEFTIGFAAGDDRFRIHMDLDYDLGTVGYRHSYPQREDGGMNSGHFLPLELENILTEEFVDLFVFNGELTDDFIETGENKAENALKIVTRLDRVEAQRAAIERVVEEQQEEDGAKTEQGLKQVKSLLENREDRLARLKETRDRLEDEISEHDSTIESLKEEREKIISKDKEALKKYQEYQDEIKELETTLQTNSASLLDDMRVPSKLSSSFHEDFTTLLEHMRVLRLPKSTSKEFFSELAEQDTCVCGRDLDEKHRDEIRENAERFLSDEDVGVLNALKERLGSISEPVALDEELEELRETRKELKKYQTQRDQLGLSDENLEEKKQDLTRQIESEKTDRENKERKVELLTTDDKGLRQRHNLDWEKNIPEAKREVTKYKEKVEAATDTVTFSAQAEKLDMILDDFVSQAVAEVKRDQINKTNQRLSRILKRSSVQIDSIDDSINLKNKSGSSEGQSLAVAYAYLSTLFEGSAVDMPFVIDSPAVSLDHKVRSEVAPIISQLFDQVIAFIISTEKEGFVENLEPATDNDINYYTVYKTDSPGELRMHDDKDFFMDFTSEEEEDGDSRMQSATEGE
ncbi:coiled-coil domain-containing protein [Halorubrum salsamenti]|uniref:AAA family ATPase n=1 Tax=Halorubrum salsamenti TaxID=2583990 RepID=UPI00119D59DC|nr:AAA family ATPase [Halorubrum salsamenti]